MPTSTGEPESRPSSRPLLPCGGPARLSPAAEEDGLINETVLTIPQPPKGSSSSRWWGGGKKESTQWNGGIMPFSLPKRKRLKGPLRAGRLCLLSILLPALLLTLPLYVRYRVYGRGESFPLAASDMRLIDSHVSTTWCQGQLVEANASFNAFLMPETPQVEDEPQKMSMHRSIYLSDDMKEYWGFYLLKGSTVSLSACARWPGASLIVIRGHRHLRECAYIGQKSSEESDEIMVVDEEAELNHTQAGVDISKMVVSGRARHKIRENEKISWKSAKVNPERAHHHRHKVEPISTGQSNERKTVNPLSTAELSDTSSEIYDDILQKILQMGDRGKRVLERLTTKLLNEEKAEESRRKSGGGRLSPRKDQNSSEGMESSLLRKIINQVVNEAWEREKIKRERNDHINPSVDKMEGSVSTGLKDGVTTEAENLRHKRLTSLDENDDQDKEDISEDNMDIDKEAENILARARRGILKKSLEQPNAEEEDQGTEVPPEVWEGLEEGHVPKPDGIADDRGVFDHWDPNDRSRSEFWSSFSSSEEALLVCEGLVLYMPLTPHLSCNENESLHKVHHHQSDNKVATEGRHGVTETSTAGEEERDNTLSYQVPANGYYFFVFNSENEVQTNFIHVHFDLRRRVYRIKDPIAMCHNSSHCELPLSFFSNQKVVLQLPLHQGEMNHSEALLLNRQLAYNNQTVDSNATQDARGQQTSTQSSNFNGNKQDENGHQKESLVDGEPAMLWDESYVVVTTCEPRTTLYLCFIVAVPLLILLFAFQ